MARTIGESSVGFVLHSYPYSETSLILEAFTRTHGRIVFMAKGAKRPTSVMKSVLNPFQQLHFSWFGKADMKTLKSAEHERIFPQLSGATLMSAFYMNELLLKLTHREEAHDALFDSYQNAVAQLSGGQHDSAHNTHDAHDANDKAPNPAPGVPFGAIADVPTIATVLRKFEISLLQEIGYGLQLTTDADTEAPLNGSEQYFYVFERGPIRAKRGRNTDAPTSASTSTPTNGAANTYDALQLHGKTLLDMAANDYRDPVTQNQSKQLMRRAINHVLGDKTLHTRQLIRDLQAN